jgi:hypothetical protein
MQFERLAEDATALERRFFDAISGSNKTGKSHCHHRLAVVEEYLPEVDGLRSRFEVLMAPATKKDLATHLAVLVKSFPNTGKDNAEIYGRMLLEDVGAQRPTLGALEAACHHLRRTNNFLPVIAEVLAALKDASKQIDGLQKFLTGRLPYQRKIALQEIEQQKEWDREQERIDARRAQTNCCTEDF